ncbi:sodium:solute symporter family protein [Sporosarcina saromensis]|uniref:Sodium:solute symporter family protein n=1 Tax=Sporosarcina saromensis TaxID=359365 RepID=A0ABU4G7Z3_9BACL|nr:sodium:solute symporter family protein [Sporosarcina saromensis]MDW0113100.1 sodium:solute symporter family protein [Sporosarcina saromensis]
MYLFGLIAYLFLMVVIGYFASRKVKSSDDYLVAGRGLSLPVLVGTLTAGWLGAGTVVGYASIGYNNGFGALWWAVGGLSGALIIVIMAKKLRAIAKYTVPDLLELRFSPLARILGAIPIILAFTAIVGYQMKAVGYVLEVIMNIDARTGLIIGAFVVIAYTVAGGMISVAYTDVAQYVLLIVGLIIATPIAFKAAGGFAGWNETLPVTHFEPTGGLGIIGALAVLLPFFMLATVDQNLYQRMFSAESAKTAKKGAIIALISASFVMVMVFFISLSSRSLFPNIKGDLAVYTVATDLLNPVLGTVLLIAVLSIIMSTSDSYLLSPATNIVKDIYVRFMKPEASDRSILLQTRIWVVILGVLALSGALWFETVLQYAMVAYTIYGAGVFFPIVTSFFWKGATNAGAVSAIIGGTISTIVWEFFITSTIPTIYIGGTTSLVLLIAVSLVTKHAASEDIDLFIRDAKEDVEETIEEKTTIIPGSLVE